MKIIENKEPFFAPHGIRRFFVIIASVGFGYLVSSTVGVWVYHLMQALLRQAF